MQSLAKHQKDIMPPKVAERPEKLEKAERADKTADLKVAEAKAAEAAQAREALFRRAIDHESGFGRKDGE